MSCEREGWEEENDHTHCEECEWEIVVSEGHWAGHGMDAVQYDAMYYQCKHCIAVRDLTPEEYENLTREWEA